jgi:hypothetical protein
MATHVTAACLAQHQDATPLLVQQQLRSTMTLLLFFAEPELDCCTL